MSGVLKTEIEEKLSRIQGVKEAYVEVTFEPPWNQSLMTEAARLQLGTLCVKLAETAAPHLISV